MNILHDGRRYEEGCFSAHALDIVGDRWTLLIVRELMLGPLRFAEIKAGISGIAANILLRRLEELERTGILRQSTQPSPVAAQAYLLTAAGQALWPVIRSLCRWGATQAGHDPTLFVSPTSVMLSMGAVYGGKRLSLDAGFNLDGAMFTLRLEAGRPLLSRAKRLEGDLTFTGTPNGVGMAIYGPWPLAESVEQGRVIVTGDPGLAQAFVDGFDLQRADTEPAPFNLVPT